jgi:hypothetical protein
MDGSARKSVECTKPIDGGMENKVRGHRQRRSENQQMDKHSENGSYKATVILQWVFA